MKKILILGLSLLILAGIVVVLFRGFNVNFLLEQHEVVEFTIGKDFEIADVKAICKEVFGKKQVVLRKIEVFNDSVSINVSSITNEEKENLVNKLNEKFGTTKNVAEVEIKVIPKVRIRDWVKPYIKPIIVSAIIIVAYMAIRFREENLVKLFAKIVAEMALTILAILSVCAIFRVPMSPIHIMCLTAIALVELLVYIAKLSNEKVEEK